MGKVKRRFRAVGNLFLVFSIAKKGVESMGWQDGMRSAESSAAAPPVEEGKEYDVKITDMGRDGDGIARIQGFVIFVPGTQFGDELKIKVISVKRRVAFADKAQ